MIDLEHCTVLGNENIDANSLNRCMFNLHRKMLEASERTIGSESENIPSFPFFSGGHENALTDIDYVTSLNATSADSKQSGVVARLYSGDLNIYGSQDNPSFATESETGTYFYSAEQLSTFAPSVSSLFNQSSPLILRSILTDDESTMISGVSSFGIASSPIVKFTSYLTCSKSGISFGTITFKRNNGDQQENTIRLNIARDLIGIDGVDSVDFFSIGNGFSSGVQTVSENLEMVSDIGQCTVTYLSDNDVAISNITKNDNSDYIKVDRETGRIVDTDDNTFGRYIELPNDEVVLNFFTMFTLKDDVVKYTDDLWCFYIVYNNEKNILNDATAWARDYFKYSFDNFLIADNGYVDLDGTKRPTDYNGCTIMADDAFNGCYNATFKSLCWFSPSLRYADRMFKGCTHASFDSLPNILHFNELRSAVSMFEDCMEASFGKIKSIEIPKASRLMSMFEGCTHATFDNLETIDIRGDVSRMFYGDYSSEFHRLASIEGYGSRFISMFEGCDNAEFPELEHIKSEYMSGIDASRMFYRLNVPTFNKLKSIELSPKDELSVGYNGVSMFEECHNATFENLTSLGNIVDGTRMFFGCDSLSGDTAEQPWQNKCTFKNLTSIGDKLIYGNEMFRDNPNLFMTIKDTPRSLADGTFMFTNTSSVSCETGFPSLITAREMFSNVVSATVSGDMPELIYGEKMFANDDYVAVNGNMGKLINANSMFTNSGTVYVSSFPGRVEDALNSFADISGSCKIDDWSYVTHDRRADNCFSHSKNIWINGNIIAGKTVSTSHMFDSAENITLFNEKMENNPDDTNHKFFWTGAGDHFVYLQRMSSDADADADALSGEFTIVGNSTFNELSSYIASSFETSSLVVAATMQSTKVKYDIYSVGDNKVELLKNDFDFNVASSLEFSADYFYANVEGYTESSPQTSMLAIRKDETINTESITSFYLYNATNIDGATTDNRKFVLTASTEYGEHGFHFAEYEAEDSINPIMWGDAYYNQKGYNIVVYPGQIPAPVLDVEYKKSFSFDFIQLDDYPKEPKLVISCEDDSGKKINKYAISAPIGGGNADIIPLGKDSYHKLMIENSKDKINVRIMPVRKYGDKPEESTSTSSTPSTSVPYGYLMRYQNEPYRDNRISLHICNGNSGIPQEMKRCPKGYVGDYTVAQIFSDHRFEDDVPFGLGSYGVSSLESSSTTRFRTRFTENNAADLEGYWEDANSMFYNVEQDSLLSGYYCFSDISLKDTRDMFAREEYKDDDKTFKHAGPLMQNLANSHVWNMDGMFRNRCVVNPTVFKDLHYEGADDNDSYISFQIPFSVKSASAAFMNCHISSIDVDADETTKTTYTEIGFRPPSSLTMADDMFNGYQGPNIRFGYDSNGYVYIANGFSGERMFNGCTFTNTPSEKFGLDVPTIYLNMFEGSNFAMNNISSLNVRDGLNFANPYPYSNEMYFYNDTKLLGCSSISFDSLETDVLDWFCTDTNDVEGVYLATVIGPKNRFDETKKPPTLTADYRLMVSEAFTSTSGKIEWSKPRMSDRSQFTPAMTSDIFSATNKLGLNKMKEFENRRGRATCMFNPSILFNYSISTLGDTLSSNLGYGDYDTIYNDLTNDTYIGSTYNQMEFGLLEKVNAIEMPFAFAGLSSATFDSLSFVGTSAIMGYGAFMNCTAASFDSLKSISFMQNGLNQPNSFSSRFSTTEIDDWYGNYCNMFAGCSSASMSSLESILLNSKYDVYGQYNDRVLSWFDLDGYINYMTYSNFTSRFTFAFDATTANHTFKMAISNYGFEKFFDYDTGIPVSEISSVDVRFKVPAIGSDDVLSIIEVNKIDEPVSFNFFIDTAGNVSNLSSTGFINNYSWELSGDDDNDNCNKTYFVMDTITSYNSTIPPPEHPITPKDEGERKEWEDYDISKKAKFLVLFRNATGFHSVNVDKNYMIDINYKVRLIDKNGECWIKIYDNNTVGSYNEIKSQWLTGVKIDDSCKFKMEMTEINDVFTPLLTITDAHKDEYIYEILADGTVNRLAQHPERGVVKEVYKMPGSYPFKSDNKWTQIDYMDSYGQNYNIVCSSEDSTKDKPTHYIMRLSSSDTITETEVAELHTPISTATRAEDVYFTIGTYLTKDGFACIIVGIADKSGNNVYYKIYDNILFDNGKSYKYVEQTPYNPAQRFDYKLLTTMEFGSNVAIAHKAYCSGMFMHEPSATFEKLDMINLPAIGSCAGMFSDVYTKQHGNSNGTKLFSSLKYMVLPRTAKKFEEKGYLDYRGILSGVPISSVTLSGLTAAHTNIYALGINGEKTIGCELFYGMLDNKLNPFDDTDNLMTETIAVTALGLNPEIAEKMDWSEQTIAALKMQQ